jgi:hypothetical protein
VLSFLGMTNIEDTKGPRLKRSMIPACLSLSTYSVSTGVERVCGPLRADLPVNQKRTPGNSNFLCAGETSKSSLNVLKDSGGECMSGHVKETGGVN